MAKGATAERVRVGAKRQVTLPTRAARALRVREGDYLEVRVKDDKIELVPLAMVPRDQAWFWTREWQAKEKEAEKARAAGDYIEYKDVEKAIRRLKS